MTPEEKAAADAAEQARQKELTAGNDFSALLGDLKKACPPSMGGGESSESEEQESSEEEERGGRMGKAFKVKLEGGEEVEAVDGTELLKAFGKKQGKLYKAFGAMQPLVKALVDSNTAMVKKLGELETANTTIKAAHEDLKKAFDAKAKEHDELKKSLDTIANAGRGRKSATVVLPDSKGADGQPKGMKPQEFMAKALRLQSEGKITGSEVAVAEAHINRGSDVPLHIVQKVFADAA